MKIKYISLLSPNTVCYSTTYYSVALSIISPLAVNYLLNIKHFNDRERIKRRQNSN